MNVRTIFKSEEEIAKHFGDAFLRKVRSLVEVYERHGRHIRQGVLRAAALAFAFYGAAQESNSIVMRHFDEMLHGAYTEYLYLDNQAVWFDEDNCDVSLVWDLTALMLEEGEGLAQEAYDVVGNYVWMAYKMPVDQKQPVSAVQQMAVETKPLNNNIKPIDKDTACTFMMAAAKDGNKAAVEQMISTYAQNLIQRYFPEEYAMLEEVRTELAKHTQHTISIGELIAAKYVETEIKNVESGATGVVKYNKEV